MDKIKLSNHISKASVGKLCFAVALRVRTQKNVSVGPRFNVFNGFMYKITDVNIEVSPLCEWVFLEENRT